MSERITIVFETGNASFSEQPYGLALARVLRRMADRAEQAGMLPAPKDCNGNTIGTVTVAPTTQQGD